MKTAGRIVGVVLVFLVLALVVVRVAGFNPIGNVPGPGNYPGLWLSGDVVKTPVTDWSFVTQFETDKVQTRTWYLIPHSVTTGFVLHDGKLYLTSNFPAGRSFPDSKSWTKNVMRDPHVRVKFGNNLYDCIVSHVTDPNERAAVLASRAVQNTRPASSNVTHGAVMHLFHVVSDPEGTQRSEVSQSN
jgi:hypothetical protein